jgi:hypothetical protein
MSADPATAVAAARHLRTLGPILLGMAQIKMGLPSNYIHAKIHLKLIVIKCLEPTFRNDQDITWKQRNIG